MSADFEQVGVLDPSAQLIDGIVRNSDIFVVAFGEIQLTPGGMRPAHPYNDFNIYDYLADCAVLEVKPFTQTDLVYDPTISRFNSIPKATPDGLDGVIKNLIGPQFECVEELRFAKGYTALNKVLFEPVANYSGLDAWLEYREKYHHLLRVNKYEWYSAELYLRTRALDSNLKQIETGAKIALMPRNGYSPRNLLLTVDENVEPTDRKSILERYIALAKSFGHSVNGYNLRSLQV